MVQAFDEVVDELRKNIASVTFSSMIDDMIISILQMYHAGDTRLNDDTNVSEKVNEQVQLGHNTFFAGYGPLNGVEIRYNFMNQPEVKGIPINGCLILLLRFNVFQSLCGTSAIPYGLHHYSNKKSN
jgi:hypothetical protein